MTLLVGVAEDEEHPLAARFQGHLELLVGRSRAVVVGRDARGVERYLAAHVVEGHGEVLVRGHIPLEVDLQFFDDHVELLHCGRHISVAEVHVVLDGVVVDPAVELRPEVDPDYNLGVGRNVPKKTIIISKLDPSELTYFILFLSSPVSSLSRLARALFLGSDSRGYPSNAKFS